MPRYQLTERTLIGNDITEAGEVEFDGLPSSIFIPLCKEGEAKRAEYEEIEAKRRHDNAIINGKEALSRIDPDLAVAIQHIVREALAERDNKVKPKIKPTDLA